MPPKVHSSKQYSVMQMNYLHVYFLRFLAKNMRWWCSASCPRMSVDILGTNCDQYRNMVQCCFTSTDTIRLIRTESPWRPPRLSHSCWTLSVFGDRFYIALFSALEQTHCVLVACDSKWVTSCFLFCLVFCSALWISMCSCVLLTFPRAKY